MSKRFLCLLLALLLLAGCSTVTAEHPPDGADSGASQQQQAAAAAPETLRIAAVSGDSFNPFSCETLQNSYIAELLYEPLAALSPAYEVKYRLAAEIVVTGTVCAVTLRSGLRFANGSALTAADVVYSLNTARGVSRYSAQLSGVVSVEATGEDTVVLTLAQPDVFFDRCLTVPIVQQGTAFDNLPVGAGRFLYDSDTDTLQPNPNYWDGGCGIQAVSLLRINSDEEQSFAVISGDVDLIYSDLRGSIDLGISTGHSMVTLNNLVFVGVNCAKWQFSNSLMQLLSQMIPRSELVGRSYSGYATATQGILNPALSGLDSALPGATAESVTQALVKAGFGEPGADGWRSRNGAAFTLSLIVSSGNQNRLSAAQQIADGFAKYGVHIAVAALDYQEYLARIEAGNYDLYLGEIRLSDNMDVSALITPGPGLSSGIVYDQTLLSAYAELRAGERTATSFNTLFTERPTVLPVAFRRGIVCYSRSFSANIIATQQDIFYNIKDW